MTTVTAIMVMGILVIGMETLEALAARINTTEDIQSIVRTMKSLSAVSIRQYERAVEALDDYHKTIERGFQAVLRRRARPAAHHGGKGAAGVIVIGSDRGLCGRFNEGITRHLEATLKAEEKAGMKRPRILTMGTRTAARLETLEVPADVVFTLPGSVEGLVKMAQAILIRINAWQEDEGVGDIRIFFNRRTFDARAEPTMARLMPLDGAYLDELTARDWPTRNLPSFTMEPERLFSWLVRQHLFISIYRACAESLASEHASRLAAMQAAERNIEEQLADLSSDFRKKRQESITTELMDIVAGFESMRGREA